MRRWRAVAAVALGVALVAGVAQLADAQAVAKVVVSLFRIYAIDAPLDVVGGVETEPVRTGRLEDIDGGYVSVPRLDAGHVVTGLLANVDGGAVLIESGVATDDADLVNGSFPTCDSSRDTHWQGGVAGDYTCVGAIGHWFRYNPIATSLYFTGNEPGTFKGPVEGRRFFIDPPAPAAESFRCYSLTATVQAPGTCIGACAGLPVEQQIARVAVGQDIAGNLCYVDVPCTAAVENVYSPPLGACGADAGSTGVRTFFWLEPSASGCTESPVLAGRIVCNITEG